MVFSRCTPVSYFIKTDRHDITEILVESGVKHHNTLTLFPIALYILLRLSSSDYLFGSSNFLTQSVDKNTQGLQSEIISEKGVNCVTPRNMTFVLCVIKSWSSWRNCLFEDGSNVVLIISLRYVGNYYMN